MEDIKKDLQENLASKSFFSFDKMITPAIIKIVFYIGLVVSVLVGIGFIISGLSSSYGGGMLVFVGVLVLVVSPLIVRVNCELLIVIFKIHESLVELKNK